MFGESLVKSPYNQQSADVSFLDEKPFNLLRLGGVGPRVPYISLDSFPDHLPAVCTYERQDLAVHMHQTGDPAKPSCRAQREDYYPACSQEERVANPQS